MDTLHEEAVGVEPGEEHILQHVLDSFFSEAQVLPTDD
jgi:hypothetical protein